MKIIFVTGWTVSGLGKWIVTASIAKLMQSSGLKIGVLKIDPYLQVDAGTMSPYEHWECYVTDDWWETDLDLGNYERFLGISLKKQNNVTTGQVYLNVIQKERAGEYLGQTVQIIPHITNEIKERITNVAKNNDITIVEVGWTVWDIEGQPFLEAIRQLKRDLWRENVFYIHLALLLELTFSWEIKTKPIQHSVIKLREYGIFPDMLICRTGKEMDEKTKNKISMLCDIDKNKVIEGKNVSTIYEVPEKLRQQNVWEVILKHFWFKNKTCLESWNKRVEKIKNPKKQVNILLIWKYTKFDDTYKSVLEAFVHTGASLETKVNIELLESDEIEKNKNILKEKKFDWIIVPWGFGGRWIEWMIETVKFARENKIPFLGICLWMQVVVIEYARNVCGLKNANSREFDENTEYKVIDIMENQRNITKKWWTMRLGSYEAVLEKGSLVEKLYETSPLAPLLKGEGDDSIVISERHRHRYEVNPEFHEILEKNWLKISWKSPDGKLVEFIEIPNHPYFVATQAHPEFKSSLEKPHPLFVWLVENSLK